MRAFTLNSHSIAQLSNRINKIISSPISSYSGPCPFLRSLSTISSTLTASSDTSAPSNQESSSDTNCKNLFSDTYASQHQNQFHYQQQKQQQQQESNNQKESCNRQAHLNESLNSSGGAVDVDQAIYNKVDDSFVARDEDGAAIKFNSTKECNDSKSEFEKTPLKHKCQHLNLNLLRNYDYVSKLNELIKKKKDDESYRVFRKVRRFSSNFPHGTEQGRPVTIWCSNDYFGMSSHPKVCEAIRQALNEYGAGSGGTRNIAGNSPVHEQLEWELADLHEKERALLFSSCYVANDSTLYTLLKLIPDCHIFSDAGNHASMIQGIRNSGARKHIFRTFDPVDLEEKLRKVPKSTPKIVAFETVHSMTGDVSEVERMCDISHEYGALTFVDEVHAVGLYGARGAGIAQRDGCMDKIDIVSGTLGKAYGNCGGYVASSDNLIDVVRSYASGFIFTTSLPPTVACGAAESVRILKSNEGSYLRELQQNNVAYMKEALTAAGLPHYPSKSHIIPIPIGDAAKCTQVSNDLLVLGHYIQSINYPTVPKGTERLRVSITPFHSQQMIDSLIEELASVWSKNNLNFLPPVELMGRCRRYEMMSRHVECANHEPWCQVCQNEVELCTRMPLVS